MSVFSIVSAPLAELLEKLEIACKPGNVSSERFGRLGLCVINHVLNEM